jgi:hypothetical protein
MILNHFDKVEETPDSSKVKVYANESEYLVVDLIKMKIEEHDNTQ